MKELLPFPLCGFLQSAHHHAVVVEGELIHGLELTRPVPNTKSDWPVGSAHFNVLFPTDVPALETADLYEALSRAKAQGAFVFWNHPGFMGKAVDVLAMAGLFAMLSYAVNRRTRELGVRIALGA